MQAENNQISTNLIIIIAKSDDSDVRAMKQPGSQFPQHLQ